ncbi:MAG: hypothetical protein ABJF50_13365 [Paracoccaceae bacterium]|uniref:hypothetical protein n=1 Tax=Hyphomonas sp. TaxID=87 RepID=UPI0032725698
MGRISPFAEFVAGAANGQGTGQLEAIAPFLSASHHACMLGRVELEGVAGGGDQPIYWFRGEEPDPETKKTLREAYEFASKLLSARPTVLISISPQGLKSRPECVRLADDFGCALIPSNSLEPEVFVHEIAHLCCFSGHPVLDEGIAFYAEHEFTRVLQFNDAPPMDLTSACRNVRTHDELAEFPYAFQVAFGRASSRIIGALVNAEIELNALCEKMKFVEPCDQLLARLETIIDRRHLDEAWGWSAQLKPDLPRSQEILAFVDGSLADEPLDGLSAFGQFLARTQLLFSNPEYDTGHVAFALQHSEWRSSGEAFGSATPAHQTVVELYRMVDEAIGCLGDPGELWEKSYAHLSASLARYPDDPLLAAAALIYLARTQMPEIPGAPSIEVLSAKWRSDEVFGRAFASLKERICE